jgi:hypothetical protein
VVIKKALRKKRFHQQTSIKQVKRSILLCMGCCLHAAKWVILKLFLLQHLHVLKAPRQELFTACDMFPTAVTSFIKFVMVIKKALSKRKFHQQTSTKPIKKNVLLCMA